MLRHVAGAGGTDENAVEHPGGAPDQHGERDPGQVGAGLGPDAFGGCHQVDGALRPLR